MTLRKHYVETGLKYLLIQTGINIIVSIVPFGLLSIVGFVLNVLALNALVKGSKDNLDFKFARWSILISVIALSISLGYLVTRLMPYIELGPELALLEFMAKEKGAMAMLTLAILMTSAINFFTYQGLEKLSANELDNPVLSKTFRMIKLLFLGIILLNILTLINISLDRFIPFLSFILTCFTAFNIHKLYKLVQSSKEEVFELKD